MSSLACNEELKESLEKSKLSECLDFLDEYSSQPMSLQKLSFVAVSSAVGADTGRRERVGKLPIPNTFKEKLLFKHAKQVKLEGEDIAEQESLSTYVSGYEDYCNHHVFYTNYRYKSSRENLDSDYNYESDD